MTALITTGLSVYGLTTRRDFSGLGSKLFFAMLASIAASIVGMFFGGSLLQVAIGLGGAVIFSLYILYEVQQARYAEDTLPNAIMIAVGLYLSIFNLFLSLLRILGIFGASSDDERDRSETVTHHAGRPARRAAGRRAAQRDIRPCRPATSATSRPGARRRPGWLSADERAAAERAGRLLSDAIMGRPVDELEVQNAIELLHRLARDSEGEPRFQLEDGRLVRRRRGRLPGQAGLTLAPQPRRPAR